jgi:hypothetical protein
MKIGEDESSLCSICLDDLTDTCAPCGFTKSRFHSKCLETLKEVQGDAFRCPHCNQQISNRNNNNLNSYWTDEIVALDKLTSLLHSWLLIPKLWVKRAYFVRVQSGMQRGEKEKRILRCLVANLVYQLKNTLHPSGGIRVLSSLSSSSEASSKKTFICRDNVSEFSIVLRRVAFIETRGSVSCDGYSLSGCRRKISCLSR